MDYNGNSYDGYNDNNTNYMVMPDYDERSDFRAEREWNQHVRGPNNYPVSATYDYPREDQDRRKRFNRSPPPHGRQDRRHNRTRSRSPVQGRNRFDDRPSRRENYDRDFRRSPRRRSPRRQSPDWTRRACSTLIIRRIPTFIQEADIRDEFIHTRANFTDIKMEYEKGDDQS